MRSSNGRFLTLAVWAWTAALACTGVWADAVDDYVRTRMELENLPGLALAVDRNGSLVKMATYGLANIELGTKVTPETVFQIQSVTKQFVATAIMMLVEEGKICVDRKVSEYLEGTPDLWKDITVRHLLTHTSGIKDFINEPTASLRLDVTDDEVFAATAARPLNFEPGERYAYSNSNYHLLAMMIRKLTGEHYGTFLKKRVFDPLGMTRTRVMSWSEIVPHRAAGYVLQDGQIRNGHYVAGSILAYGGGGLLSTIEDMVKWDLALRDERILKRSMLEQMWTPAKLNNGATSGYGFGWGLAGDRTHRIVTHSGGHMTGFGTVITRFIDDDLSIIILVNARHANPGKMARAIAAFYIPELREPERKPIEDAEPGVTQLVRQIEQGFRKGEFDKKAFTAELAAVLEPSLKQIAADLEAAGPLETVALLERTVSSDGMRRYLYRMRCARQTALVNLVLTKDGLIAGLNSELQ